MHHLFTGETEVTMRQTKEELQRRGLKIIREERVRRVQDAPRLLEQFSLYVEEKGREYVMNFYVGRQTEGGLTIAARLPARDQAALDRDVLNIVRSVVVEKPR